MLTWVEGSSAVSRLISAPLWAPPPQISKVVVSVWALCRDSTTVRAVSSSRVACTSWGQRRASGQVLLQPGQVEHLSPRAFRAFGQEKRIAEQRGEQLGLYLSAGRPLPVPIEVFAALQMNPRIEQYVPGPQSKPATGLPVSIRLRLLNPPTFNTARLPVCSSNKAS